MESNMIPEFAIVGHPNEGKSAVVSTLSEDDSVKVSSYPGETVECQTFPVVIDGQEIIRFIDTPGFQNPRKTLAWMKNYQEADDGILHSYFETHAEKQDFRDDVTLLEPINRGAGIIYVVDGSRPVRKMDLAEMEILRLTGRPRMAIINCKEDETVYLEEWKREFRKSFNAIRIFNANKAVYAERIKLLKNLKGIDQDWGEVIDTVISAFEKDWKQRNSQTAEIICDLLEECLEYSITKDYTKKSNEKTLKHGMEKEYNRGIEKIEKRAHQKIRKLFKHNIFNFSLPACSILSCDLFSKRTSQVLGMTQKQLVTLAAMTGGTVGAALDLAAAGLTFGILTAAGGLLCAGWTALGGGKRLIRAKVMGLNLGGYQIQIGPMDNIPFIYILVDRALIFYSYIINWTHGRRDYSSVESFTKGAAKAGFTAEWDNKKRGDFQRFYSSICSNDSLKKDSDRNLLKEMFCEILQNISQSDKKHGLIENS